MFERQIYKFKRKIKSFFKEILVLWSFQAF